MPHTCDTNDATHHRHAHPTGAAFEWALALSMTVARGPRARAVVALAELGPDDDVVDIGCGPGTAARTAAHTCKSVVGVDPSGPALRLARLLSAARRSSRVSFLEGTAEALPIPDCSASVAWSVSSFHHWANTDAGLGEALRVLRPGGRLLIVERLVRPGSRGLGAHGLTTDQAHRLSKEATEAGFESVSFEQRTAGRKTLAVLRGARR